MVAAQCNILFAGPEYENSGGSPSDQVLDERGDRIEIRTSIAKQQCHHRGHDPLHRNGKRCSGTVALSRTFTVVQAKPFS